MLEAFIALSFAVPLLIGLTILGILIYLIVRRMKEKEGEDFEVRDN